MTSKAERRRRPSAPRQIGANDNARLVANDDRPIPVILMLGDLPVVSLRPIDELSPGETARVRRIEAALRGRNRREASRLALDYEASQGITLEERIAAMCPANDIDRMVEEALGLAVQRYGEAYIAPPPPKREKRLKGKRKPKVKAALAIDTFPVGDLRQDEIDAVEAAEVKLKSADLGLRAEGAATMTRIRKAVATRVHKRDVEDGLSERKTLEALRGAHVSKSTRPTDMGGMLISDHDGLESLSAKRTKANGDPIPPSVSAIQKSAGLRFRTDYEMIDPEKKLTPPTLLRESKSHGGGGEGYADKVAEAWARVRATHLLIAGIHPSADPDCRPMLPNVPEGHPTRRAIYALTEIAGKGRNPNEMTKSGGTRNRLVASLCFALDKAAIVYGVASPPTTS